MRKNKEKTFEDWYNSLPANKQTIERDKIRSVCEYSWTKFYRMVNGNAQPTKLEKAEIEKIAGEKLVFPIQLPKKREAIKTH